MKTVDIKPQFAGVTRVKGLHTNKILETSYSDLPVSRTTFPNSNSAHKIDFSDVQRTTGQSIIMQKLSFSCAGSNSTGSNAGFFIGAPGPSSTINEQITDLETPHRASHTSPQILREHADRIRLQDSNTTPELNARSKVTGAELDPSITAPHRSPPTPMSPSPNKHSYPIPSHAGQTSDIN